MPNIAHKTFHVLVLEPDNIKLMWRAASLDHRAQSGTLLTGFGINAEHAIAELRLAISQHDKSEYEDIIFIGNGPVEQKAVLAEQKRQADIERMLGRIM